MNDIGILGRSAPTQDLLMRLRTDIILRKYASGELLREQTLADQHSVSRAIVRNALVQLEKEGLIQALPNGTKRVNSLEPQDITNMYDLRDYIERTAVEQLFGASGRNLEPLFNSMKAVSASKGLTVTEVLAIDSNFHRSVILASGNKAILQAWDTLSGVIEAVFQLNMTESTEYMTWFAATFQERHTQLFASLMGESKAEAMKLFTSHISDAHEQSLMAIRKVCAMPEGDSSAIHAAGHRLDLDQMHDV